MFIIIFAIIISISLGLRYGTDSNDLDTPKEYALTDKVIRSYKSDFCESLQARSTDTPNNFQSNATLYLLYNRPPASDAETFNLTETAHLTDDTNYHVWNFYLNAGSKVSLSACYAVSSTSYNAKFYLIKGNSNHNKWLDDPDKSYAEKYVRLSSSCTNGVSYQVHQDDLYYFVFYMDSATYAQSTLNINFDFSRAVYHISQDNVAQKCTIPLDGHSSCSLSVPMSSSYTALLSLNTSLPVNYDDGANVRIDCQPRAWLYAVVVLCTVVPVIVIVVSVVACICYKVRKGKKYSALTTNTVSTSTDTTSQASVNPVATESMFAKSNLGSGSTANPPPYNPAYPPASGGYGSTVTAAGAPPPYAQ